MDRRDTARSAPRKGLAALPAHVRVEAVVRVWTRKLRKEIRVVWWVKGHCARATSRRRPAQALGVATALDTDANESPWAAATPGDRESWKGREKQPEEPEAVSALSKAWPVRWARTTSKSQPGPPPRV